MDVESGSLPHNPSVSIVSNLLNVPTITRIIVFIQILLYVIGLIGGDSVVEVLALIPGNFLPPKFWCWNILTGGYFHAPQSYLSLALNIAILLAGSKSIAQLWGNHELMKYCLMVNAISGTGTFLLNIFYYTLSGYFGYLFTPIGGSYALSMAVLVAHKQLYPDLDIKVFGNILIRPKYFPLGLLFTLYTLSILGVSGWNGAGNYALSSLIISWVYLRFFQIRDGVIGDMSTQFKFSGFFPEPLQHPIDVVGGIILLALRCGRPIKSTTSNEGAPSSTNIPKFYLDSAEDAERRRRVAIKVLDEQFASKKMTIHGLATAVPTSSPPNVSAGNQQPAS
eukprot:TRINITY_DN1250_c0_g2_i1.p1 TRINITY_DN1250_c0_g2~~TRINITY_DN1250_c0_g2_i1.p1  ORF type:complete len:337 (-),score=68.51 TRINITY_DN1250_c0_g2_i1:290-1300(-)